ncbi:uncharacterized protein DFL_007963 [Arthrobotrys flagrans]|uniref:Uncharacterized protein n=1 Tax=Arthrobotrys flagrans TaxID=97331 RepID=A0A436ZXE9_ARTFL|nr:hypothetical protein DFL_007963 [Arthrobotrys flagrans]
MAICIDSRPVPNDHSYGMVSENANNDPRCIYGTFDSDFYKCLCEDLAKELDFPDQTDLRRISQLELFGSSWETDPYKKLLLRCLDHSIPRLREPLTPRSRGGSIDYTATDMGLDFDCEEEARTIPTNPPPSPALSAVNYVLSSKRTADQSDDDWLEPLGLDKLQLHSPAEVGDGYEGDNDDDEEDAYAGLAAGEIAGERRIRRQQTRMQTKHQYHRRVASTGLLATVVTSDGSIIWHFKEFS